MSPRQTPICANCRRQPETHIEDTTSGAKTGRCDWCCNCELSDRKIDWKGKGMAEDICNAPHYLDHNITCWHKAGHKLPHGFQGLAWMGNEVAPLTDKETLATIAGLREQLAAMEKSRDEWALALQSVTPGGSEYVGDPPRCVEFVRWARQSQHAPGLERERDDVRAHLASVSQASGDALGRLWQMVYPDKADWEYPGMVYRHVKQFVEEKDAQIATLTGKIEQAREYPIGHKPGCRSLVYGVPGPQHRLCDCGLTALLAVLTEEPQKCGCGLAFVGKLDCGGAGVLHHVEGPCYWVHPTEVSNGE